MTAAYCAKTLILAAASGNKMLNHCIKLLLPGLIEYVASVAASVNEQASQDALVKGTDEILKAFAAFFVSIPDEFRMQFALLNILSALTHVR